MKPLNRKLKSDIVRMFLEGQDWFSLRWYLHIYPDCELGLEGSASALDKILREYIKDLRKDLKRWREQEKKK